MLFSGPHFGPRLLLLIGGKIAAMGQPQGAAGLAGQGRGSRPGQGRGGSQAATGQQQGAAWPTAGQQGAHRGAVAGAQPLSPLRIASGGPQQGGRGDRAGKAARPLTGAHRGRRRSAGNKKPPPGQGQGQGPQGGAVGAGVSPARSAGPSHRPGAGACRGRPG